MSTQFYARNNPVKQIPTIKNTFRIIESAKVLIFQMADVRWHGSVWIVFFLNSYHWKKSLKILALVIQNRFMFKTKIGDV